MSEKSEHPSVFLDRASSDTIRQSAAGAEQLKDLHPRQLDLIYEKKWFRMFFPPEYGGDGLTLPDVLKVEESLSWADGSTGWVVTLCSGAGWFAGFLDPTLVKQVLADTKACFAGSGASTGVANIREDGYEVTGLWKYASGALHATLFTANCVICKEGRPLSNNDGSPMVKAFLFLRDEVTVLKHWNSMGMVATGSHSFAVNSLLVPSHRCFIIEGKHAVLRDPVFQYPFMQLAQTTLSVNLSGMAVRFLDECEDIFSRRPGVDRAIMERSRAQLYECRSLFYDAVELSWQRCARRQILAGKVLDEVTKASHRLAHRSIQLGDELYPYCGLRGASLDEDINRVWRDIHTASQHTLLADRS